MPNCFKFYKNITLTKAVHFLKDLLLQGLWASGANSSLTSHVYASTLLLIPTKVSSHCITFTTNFLKHS